MNVWIRRIFVNIVGLKKISFHLINSNRKKCVRFTFRRRRKIFRKFRWKKSKKIRQTSSKSTKNSSNISKLSIFCFFSRLNQEEEEKAKLYETQNWRNNSDTRRDFRSQNICFSLGVFFSILQNDCSSRATFDLKRLKRKTMKFVSIWRFDWPFVDVFVKSLDFDAADGGRGMSTGRWCWTWVRWDWWCSSRKLTDGLPLAL